MPRKLRVSSGQVVYILAHRIEAVAKRNAAGLALDHLIARMRLQEMENFQYMVVLRPLARFTGQVFVYEPSGRRYYAHHSDLIRV